ncbi:helix-turn-helix transcriptional regulator [Marinobacter sp. SS13-12]|uniref:helix-turn-helix domain-containing protein n=1 Tax=Marinobacter sp. SS13-12 TaxID=3050451 RepID=UPI0025577AEA|nr:helix-turn-helix transcriptional regulator [Marinobacter sp. SS13-12]MDK8462225.1 helix-turn-helix transcriptional regulator [Marinobacter sp. SS13-12]
MSLGQALKQLRKKQGLTLAELADQTHSHVGNLSRIERGLARPSLDLLYRLAESLGFSITDIFSVAENRQLNARQVSLNAVFISLLEEDQQLLLEFAELLQKRASHSPASINVGTEALPADTDKNEDDVSAKETF